MGFAARRTEASFLGLVLAGLVFAVGSARADERPLAEAITLATADECFALEPLLEHLAAFLGRATLDVRLAAVVEVGDGTASFEVLRDGAPGGRRRFARLPRACEDRRAVVALALALALDESAQFEPSIEPPVQTIAAVAAGPSDTVRTPVRAPAGDPAPPFGVRLQVGGGVLIGAFPVPAPIIMLDLEITPVRALSVGVGGLVTTEIDASIGRGIARVDVVGGRVSVCLERTIARDFVSFSGCVGGWFAALRARGVGFARDRDGAAPWLAVVARAQLDVHVIEWLSLFAAVDGLFVPLAPTLEVAVGGGAAVRVDLGRAGAALTAGLALSLR